MFAHLAKEVVGSHFGRNTPLNHICAQGVARTPLIRRIKAFLDLVKDVVIHIAKLHRFTFALLLIEFQLLALTGE